MRAQTALVSDPRFRRHRPGPRHPEAPERYSAAMAGIRASVPEARVFHLEPRPATDEEIELCHVQGYIDVVRRDVSDGIGCLSTGDTDARPESLDVARLAVGGGLVAVDAVMDGRAANAFCVVRPPGHHATPYGGMGFCIFNNLAIATRYAQRQHGVARVLIVDWDVHHGNGTQDAFYGDASVLYFSTHQWPMFPGTGRITDVGSGEGRGTTINRPMAAGSGRAELLAAFRQALLPAADRFAPELVMISAGFDGLAADPIGGMALVPEDFAELTQQVMAVARRHAGGRVVSMLEGGYDLPGLAAACGAHVAALSAAGETPEATCVR